ncbi:MAG: PilZ domain-containing protein [Deltaproteobacteria bacterium]|nr:PilZ domain-containing protein [Deltaproteobacteria bacterium]
MNHDDGAPSFLDPESSLVPLSQLMRTLERDLVRTERTLDVLTLVVLEFDGCPSRPQELPVEVWGEAVRRLAGRIETCIRASDQAFGGHSGRFGLVLPGTPKDEALRVAERLRPRVPELFTDLPGEAADWTVSFGLAAYPGDAKEAGALWESAVEALDAARESGGNRSWLHQDDRRSARRVPVDLGAMVHPLGRDPVEARVVNLSEVGLALETTVTLPRGNLLEIRFEDGEGGELAACARVAWSRDTASGGQHLGVRFIETSSAHRFRLQRLLERARAAATESE